MRRPTPSPTSTRSFDLTRPQLRLNLDWTETHPLADCERVQAGQRAVPFVSFRMLPTPRPRPARWAGTRVSSQQVEPHLGVELRAQDGELGRCEWRLGVDGG